MGPSVLSGGGQLSQCREGPVLLLQFPVRGRSNYCRASEGCNQLSTGTQISTQMFIITPCGNMGHGHHHRTQLQQEHRPRYAPTASSQSWISPWPLICHPDQYGPICRKSLGNLHSLMRLSRSWASTQLLVVRGDMDINSDHGCCRAMAPYGNAGHPNQNGPGDPTTLRNQHGYKMWPRPWIALWSLVLPCVMYINIGPSWQCRPLRWMWSPEAQQQMVAQTPGIDMTSDNIKSHWYQHKPWLQ